MIRNRHCFISDSQRKAVFANMARQAACGCRGSYAKSIEVELKVQDRKIQQEARKYRQDQAARLESGVIFLESKIRQATGEQKAKFEDEKEEYETYLEALREGEATNDVVLLGGTKKLREDIRYVLKNYFPDFDPSYLKCRLLKLGFSGPQYSDGWTKEYWLESPQGNFELHEVLVNPAYQSGADLKTDKVYLDTLIHEITHWQRVVDVRRQYSGLSEKRRTNDQEETETIMEGVLRIGKDAPSGSKGYYQDLKIDPKITNPREYDNRILNKMPVTIPQRYLPQIVENIKCRGDQTLISKLKTVPPKAN